MGSHPNARAWEIVRLSWLTQGGGDVTDLTNVGPLTVFMLVLESPYYFDYATLLDVVLIMTLYDLYCS